jgi:membrane-associated protein
MPFVRTFAPFVAGVAQMTRGKFTLYDITGGLLWVASLTILGYFFGNIPMVKQHLDKVIYAMIIIPGLFVMWGAWKTRAKDQS